MITQPANTSHVDAITMLGNHLEKLLSKSPKLTAFVISETLEVSGSDWADNNGVGNACEFTVEPNIRIYHNGEQWAWEAEDGDDVSGGGLDNRADLLAMLTTV